MEDKSGAISSLEKTSPSILTYDDKLKEEESQSGVINDEQEYVIPEDRKLGFTSVVFLIVNMMIGTGIFSTPAYVYRAVNNVGSAFMLWLTGAVITISGLNLLLV